MTENQNPDISGDTVEVLSTRVVGSLRNEAKKRIENKIKEKYKTMADAKAVYLKARDDYDAYLQEAKEEFSTIDAAHEL